MNNPIINKNHQLTQYNITNTPIQVVLIGAGIMSATLGILLNLLEPSWLIHMYERLKKPAQESSNVWNNAGTGHAAFCELHYTKYNKYYDSINIEKALTINIAFELSLQFWAYLTQKRILNHPQSFINNIPHMSFVWGEKNTSFLKKRFLKLKQNILFKSMMYSEDIKQIYKWIPLMIQGRDKNQKIAATRTEMGTDINFEEITKQLLNYLVQQSNFKIFFENDVKNITRWNDKVWNIHINDKKNQKKRNVHAYHIFIGGGGQSLNLIQTSKISEIQGYAGFPVGGQFLVTYNPKIIAQHSAKVYGKTSLNTPPMSVPHIDTRILHGKKVLLFGPFATFSSKFLKYGSWLDLLHSLNKDNIIPMIQAGIDNLDMIQYLLNQLMMSQKDRINILRQYYPTANPKDWSLIQAGQRVQIIKNNSKNRGSLQFGTEIITSHDKTISALLGASPGASTSVAISIQILNAMFKNEFHSDLWQNKLKKIAPSYISQFSNNEQTINNQIQQNTRNILNLLSIY